MRIFVFGGEENEYCRVLEFTLMFFCLQKFDEIYKKVKFTIKLVFMHVAYDVDEHINV